METVEVAVDADIWFSTFSLEKENYFEDTNYSSSSEESLIIYYAYSDSN